MSWTLRVVVVLFLTGSLAGQGLLGIGEARVVEGRRVGDPPAAMADVNEATSAAVKAVIGALGNDGALRSESQDRKPDCVRSFTWDHILATSILAVKGETMAPRAIEALLNRQNIDGSFPVMVCVDSVLPGSGDRTPGASQTAFAVAVLAGLVNRHSLNIDMVQMVMPRLALALKWMESAWTPGGGFGIEPGKGRASTEGTALATMAYIELERLSPGCCRQRVITAASVLGRQLWRGDHFARGLDRDSVDDDQTGAHTHQSLAVLALVEAARAYPGETPDPARYDAIPWLMAQFKRVSSSAGRTVEGLGDRLILADRAGLLYGCDGGTFGSSSVVSGLSCPAGSIRRANPNPHNGGCYSPYGTCAVAVNEIPPDASAVQSVNAEITLLSAMAAMALGRAEESAFLLNGGLALQRPTGAVIAIAGPSSLTPGQPLLYPINYRRLQFGYTALMALALQRINAFAPGSQTALATSLPPGLRFPQDRYPAGVDLTALRADPPSGVIGALSPTEVIIQNLARSDGWVRAYTDIFDDLAPAACYVFKARVVDGLGWPDFELKVIDGRSWSNPLPQTYGRRFYGLLSSAPRDLAIPLQTLGLFWPRDGMMGSDPIVLGQLEFVQSDTAPGQNLGIDPRLHLADLELQKGDCIEGAPPLFRFERVAIEGETRPFPVVGNAVVGRRNALRMDFDIHASNNQWQRVIAHDRWQWSCVEELTLYYVAAQATRVQLVLEDGQALSNSATGARWFVETTLPRSAGWTTWRISPGDFRRFDNQDVRPLDWNSIRQVAIAVIPGAGTAREGTIYLDTLVPAARSAAVDAGGICVKR